MSISKSVLILKLRTMTNHSEKACRRSRYHISTMNSIRMKFRNKFIEKLKQHRREAFDNRRCLKPDVIVESVLNRSYDEIKADILSNEDFSSNFWNVDEIIALLNEVHQAVILEEVQQKAEIVLRSMEEELCCLLDGLVVKCCVCDGEKVRLNSAEDGNCVVCENCVALHFQGDCI